MRLRLVAALAAVTALLAAPADAAYGRDQITDAKGDTRGGVGALDILSARWSTAGRGANKALVATMTLAATPESNVPYVYHLKSEVRGCGTVWFQYAPGSSGAYWHRLGQPAVSDGDSSKSLWIECGTSGSGSTGSALLYKELTLTAKGNTVSWSVPISALPPGVAINSVFHDFSAIADAGEPVFGQSAAGIVGQSLDVAYGDGTWRMR